MKNFTPKEKRSIMASLSSLLLAEEDHLKFLQDNDAPKVMIDESKKMLAHFELRVVQYKNYFYPSPDSPLLQDAIDYADAHERRLTSAWAKLRKDYIETFEIHYE